MSETDRETEEDTTEGNGGPMDHSQDMCAGGDKGISSIQVIVRLID